MVPKCLDFSFFILFLMQLCDHDFVLWPDWKYTKSTSNTFPFAQLCGYKSMENKPWQRLCNILPHFRCLIFVRKYKPGGRFWFSVASCCQYVSDISMWSKAVFCFPSPVTSRRSVVISRSCPLWPYEAGKRQDGECTTPEVKGTAVCKVLSTGWQKGRGGVGFKWCPS